MKNFDDPLDYFRQSDKPHDKMFVQAIEDIRREVKRDLEELRKENEKWKDGFL